MSDRNAWNEIIVQSIPTKRKEPSDDGDDDDDDDVEGLSSVIAPFSFLRYLQIGI